MKNPFIKLFPILLILTLKSSGLVAQEFRLSSYLKEGEKDATLAAVTMMQEASKFTNSRVIIEEGTYHFYPEKAYEQFCYVSNHDNTLRKIAFPIKDFDGLTLEANGAKFIFHGVMMPFLIENSKNVDVSGFTIDWHIPLHGEALIVASDPDKKSIDLKISNELPYIIRDEELIFIKEGYEHDIQGAILYDPQRRSVAYNTNQYTPLRLTSKTEIRNKEKFDFHNFINFRFPEYERQDKEYNAKAEEIAPGLVRISGLTRELPPVGMVLVSKGRGTNRIANAIHINKSSNVRLHDLTIHHAGGMGIIGERSMDITLDKVNLFANPEKDYLVSTTADASHFVNCKGSIVINNCNFRHQLDDATNVHGAFVVVDDILGPDKIGVRIGHFQQFGFEFSAPGDRLGFINQTRSNNPEFEATVKSQQKVNSGYYILTLNEQVADKLSDDYVVENLDWYPELTITNNQFADNRARGILLSTPRKTVVRNNYFSNMMSAILIPVELSWWYESGTAQDLLIEGNTFGDCAYGGGKQPVISIHTNITEGGYTFGSISIQKNTFNTFNPTIVRANSVKYLEFTNNSITNSNTFKPLDPEGYCIDVDGAETLIVKGVKFGKDFKNKLNAVNVKNQQTDIK